MLMEMHQIVLHGAHMNRLCRCLLFFFFFFNDTATTEIYTLSLHDALPIFRRDGGCGSPILRRASGQPMSQRSEEHTSELQSHVNLVCRLLLEKKKKSDGKTDARTTHRVGNQQVREY